ncbi:hypothetical protein ABEP17_06450 [Priestia flexa]|jgi:hypothetical protein|uniref:hypothetical protein n=1 Tax=Bacillaceae TaxID=186817 RepID=UPI0007A4B4B6|nr:MULTISPECIES: hypothetical protein [Bacillaceae]KZB89871.1 hypothetical protein A2U94_19240 [Bacillus sp. VT 712]MCG7314158.1 hypothetical protein [Priestia flexa]
MSGLIIVGVVGSTIIAASVGESKLLKVGKYVESEMVHNLTCFILGVITAGSFFWLMWDLVQKFIWGFM